tara:strand:- start:655 stop:1395 length:741 start_codon:yes stop_codon:yes gene_type:complete
MATGLQVDERVFVPTSTLDKEVQSPSAFFQTRVLAIEGRSARVDVGGGDTELVATSKCQRNIGIGIFAVGDLESESVLIDPLSKSVLQFARLLSSDDYVFFHRLRSVAEFAAIWRLYHANYSHVVIVGHGNGSAMKFGVDGWVGARDLEDAIDLDGVGVKCFVNLSCQLGKAAFGKPFSDFGACHSFIAPFHSVHGAVASHFAQSFLIYNLLHGETQKVAFRHARQWVAGATSFRMWRDGEMITDG